MLFSLILIYKTSLAVRTFDINSDLIHFSPLKGKRLFLERIEEIVLFPKMKNNFLKK